MRYNDDGKGNNNDSKNSNDSNQMVLTPPSTPPSTPPRGERKMEPPAVRRPARRSGNPRADVLAPGSILNRLDLTGPALFQHDGNQMAITPPSTPPSTPPREARNMEPPAVRRPARRPRPENLRANVLVPRRILPQLLHVDAAMFGQEEQTPLDGRRLGVAPLRGFGFGRIGQLFSVIANEEEGEEEQEERKDSASSKKP